MSNIVNKNKIKAIQELLKSKVNNRAALMKIKRVLARKYGIGMLENSEILNILNVEIKKQPSREASQLGCFFILRRLLRKRSVRTLSGIAPVAVLTKPYPCPGKCAYCPTEPDVPQSYLSNEPAVMRAIRCKFNPYVQVQERLRALIANGHEPTKIELIVIGGTWSVLPSQYKYWFIMECFRGGE